MDAKLVIIQAGLKLFFVKIKLNKMIVKIEDTIYKVSWKHTMPNEEGNGSTRCTIEVIKDMTTNPYVTELVDTAVAFCHSNDQFNKSTGRKYSLRKALSMWKLMVFGLEKVTDQKEYQRLKEEVKRQRKLFWDAYFKEHKK